MIILSTIAIHQLESIRAILEQLSTEEFIRPLPLLEGTSIGKHIRHTLEFHQCLFEESAVISYDNRSRNEALENNLEDAQECLDWLITHLKFVQVDRVLNLTVQYGESVEVITSSMKRELTFLIEHTVHHMAILRIALNTCFPAIQYEKTFGYADSTVRFLQQSNVTH